MEWTAKNPIYEITGLLGEGLTSQVYSAFRRDPQGHTRQEVALKILKSQKHVQALKTEFDKLLQIQSQHCVQVLAWDCLKQGHALVLERIKGGSLAQIQASHPCLDRALVTEIGVQIKQGLLDLNQQGICHADLSPKNILINMDGMVKLIDFGFYEPGKSAYFTPDYAHPDLLKGDCPQPSHDQYALHRILSQLNPLYDPSWLERGQSLCANRKKLSHLVQQSLQQGITQVHNLGIQGGKRKVRSLLKPLMVNVGCLLLVMALSIKNVDPPLLGEVQVAGYQEWLTFSVNSLPEEYVPLARRSLRAGTYRIDMRTRNQSITKELKITPEQVYLIRPSEFIVSGHKDAL
jgi:serine/threonine protein kinase